MRVTTEQMSVLMRPQLAARDAAFLRYARRRFPDVVAHVDDSRLAAFVAGVRNMAVMLDVNTERDVATVFDLVVMYGADFHQADWARDVLALTALDGSRRIEALRQRIRRQVPGF